MFKTPVQSSKVSRFSSFLSWWGWNFSQTFVRFQQPYNFLFLTVFSHDHLLPLSRFSFFPHHQRVHQQFFHHFHYIFPILSRHPTIRVKIQQKMDDLVRLPTSNAVRNVFPPIVIGVPVHTSKTQKQIHRRANIFHTIAQQEGGLGCTMHFA